MKIFCVILLGVIIPFLSQAQHAVPDSVVSQLKYLINGFQSRYHSLGITVAVVHDKDIVFSESSGFADIENKIPVTIDSKYPIMSVTKTFTATMLMQLVERGVVRLDDKAVSYIPEFRDRRSSKKESITLLQLATHTSGLPRNTQADIHFAEQVDKWFIGKKKDSTLVMSTDTELLKSLPYIVPEYPLYDFVRYGDRHYSNLGYSLLGIALQRASRNNYADYIVKRICEPLKMRDTGFVSARNKQDQIVPGYWYDSKVGSFVRTPVFVANSAEYAGGMYSTARDLAKFISFQFQSGSPVLSDEMKAMMQTFNIGWKPSYPFVLHEGAMLGHRCVITFNTELKIGWCILTNTTDFDFSVINDRIARVVTPLYAKKPISDLTRFVGMYRLTGGYGNLDVYMKNGSLYSTYLSDLFTDAPMIPLGNNRFKVEAKGTTYSVGYDFIPDGNSDKVILNMGQLMWVKDVE